MGSSVKSLSIGDHVVVDPDLKCGVCRYCRSDRPNLCENLISIGIDINGGYATYMRAPENMRSTRFQKTWIGGQPR